MRKVTHTAEYVIVPLMSSKSAAGRGAKSLLLDILSLIETGHPAEIPSRKLQYLQRYSYITPASNGYRLTVKGVKRLSEERIWDLQIPTPKVWDKKWHMVLFDIPVDKRKRRDSFRLRLKELGLALYQNSVWVYPYPLEDTVRTIADFYKLRNCISFITAERVSGEAGLRKQFNL